MNEPTTTRPTSELAKHRDELAAELGCDPADVGRVLREKTLRSEFDSLMASTKEAQRALTESQAVLFDQIVDAAAVKVLQVLAGAMSPITTTTTPPAAEGPTTDKQ